MMLDIESKETNQNQIKKFIMQGKEKGYVTFQDISDSLPKEATNPEQIEVIAKSLDEIGIQVIETLTEEKLMRLDKNETIKAELDEQALIENVSADWGRTTDTTRLYMREMGGSPLLSKEEEVVLAKRIEAGYCQALETYACYSRPSQLLINEFKKVCRNEIPLKDIVLGLTDSKEHCTIEGKQRLINSETLTAEDIQDGEKLKIISKYVDKLKASQSDLIEMHKKPNLAKNQVEQTALKLKNEENTDRHINENLV